MQPIKREWKWAVATNDEVTRIKTGDNHSGGWKPDGFFYWYNRDGRAVMRWNPETEQNELRL
jgi:sugar lactone lactonase YvrE